VERDQQHVRDDTSALTVSEGEAAINAPYGRKPGTMMRRCQSVFGKRTERTSVPGPENDRTMKKQDQ